MDSQVKERIVGAAVLVALGVWLIPWVLDGPDSAPGPAADPAELELPSIDEPQAPIRTETVELGQDAEPLGAPQDEIADAAAGVAVAIPDSGPEPASREAGAAAPARVEPELVAANAGPWSVQLGAFSEVANAEQQVARVAAYGYSASVSNVVSSGNTLYRVRVGGYETQGEAEAAAGSLSAHGFRVRVIAPE